MLPEPLLRGLMKTVFKGFSTSPNKKVCKSRIFLYIKDTSSTRTFGEVL